MKQLRSLSIAFLLACILVTAVRAASITLTTTLDEVNGNTASIAALIATPGGAGISLREAIIAANNTAGADTITLPAGTYTLTRVGNDSTCQNGDLDINGSLTLSGAGAATTIIQGATDAAFTGSIGDKVIGINQDGTFTNLTVAISSVTIRYGRNTIPSGDPSFAYTGGGVDVFLTGTGNAITFSNCVITGNENVNSYGGGVNIDSGTSFLPGDPAVNTVNRGTVTFVQCTLANNKALQVGGGANLFSDIHNVTFNNCLITNNTTTGLGGAGAQGGGVNLRHTYGGAVNISNSTLIVGNTGLGYGGGVCVSAPHLGSVTIRDSTISGNTVLNNGAISGAGGGVYNDGPSTVLTNLVIANNTAVVGGGLFVGAGSLNVSYSRILNNSAPTGRGAARSGGTATVLNNWWGTNAPASLMSGTISYTPWLMLRHVASPTTITVPNATTLTATFLTNSAGTFIPAGNLGVLTGVPITFNNAVRGTLSGAQATIQSSATATATFTATTAGAGSADAVVDGQAFTAGVAIPTGVTSINRVNASPTNLASVSWTVTFSNVVSGVTSGNFSLVNAGLGGGPAITAVTAVGGAPATAWTVTASTGSGSGTLGLNLANGTAVSATLVNVPFAGQVYTIDLAAPNTTITAQPPVLTNSASASFSFAGSDTGVGVTGFQCQLDGAAYTNCTSPVSYTGLSSASHTFNVRAVDGAGNIDGTPATFTWMVDTTAPTLTCSTNITVTANGSCPAVVNYLVAASDNVGLALTTTNPASGSAFAVGTNTVTLGARDTAGNTNFCTFKVIVLPGAAPQLSIVRGGTNVVVSWTNSFPCYALQSAMILGSNSWSLYPGPFTTNGGIIYVTNSLAITNKFFRLSF